MRFSTYIFEPDKGGKVFSNSFRFRQNVQIVKKLRAVNPTAESDSMKK